MLVNSVSGLNLCRPLHAAAVSVSSYVPRSCWVRKALSPWSHHPSPLTLTVFLTPLPLSSLSPGGEGFEEDIHLELRLQGLSACYLVVGFCVSPYPLPKDTSLMRAE